MKERDLSIDIMKGILISLVVFGHICDSQSNVHRIIYAFHMPLYFIISGYLNNFVTTDPKSYCKKILVRYGVPYISFSIIFVILTGFNWKDFVRMVLGGDYNVTVFSYPYWFMNVLILSILILMMCISYLNFWRTVAICVFMWITVHLFQSNLRGVALPWGIEYLTISIPYMMIGIALKKSGWYDKAPMYVRLFSFVIGIVWIVYISGQTEQYNFNINTIHLSNGILDIVVPTVAFFALSCVCRGFDTENIVGKLLETIGKTSIVIFYTHAFIIYLMKGAISDTSVCTIFGMYIVCIIVGLLVYGLSKKYWFTRILLLGDWKEAQSWNTMKARLH